MLVDRLGAELAGEKQKRIDAVAQARPPTEITALNAGISGIIKRLNSLLKQPLNTF
jgi:hypothetical protein